MNFSDKIYVAGHNGLVGKAIVRILREKGYHNIIVRSSRELDLTRQADVEEFFDRERPDYVFLLAAKVGNVATYSQYPVDFLYDNIEIQNNVINASYKYNVKKLLFTSSFSIYPRNCSQPMKEEDIFTGVLEPTNEAYALSKIVGMKLCQYYCTQFHKSFVSVIPPNIYGVNDNFSEKRSSVMTGLIKRIYEAKVNNLPEVIVWGTGNVYREFIYVDDFVDACLFIMNNYEEPNGINVGTGYDISIKELAILIKDVIGYEGNLTFDTTKPDGMPKRKLDVSKIESYGWKYRVDLREGITRTFNYYLDTLEMRKGE